MTVSLGSGIQMGRNERTRTPIQLTVRAAARALQSLYHGRCASLTQVSFSYLYIRIMKRRYSSVKKEKDASCSASPAKKICQVVKMRCQHDQERIANARRETKREPAWRMWNAVYVRLSRLWPLLGHHAQMRKFLHLQPTNAHIPEIRSE